MKIINLKIDVLKPYDKNPRKNKDAVKYVAESIKEFGFKQPIVIDKNNVIVCGHTRLLAAKQLGLKEVPCILADDLTEEQINAYRLVDNKTNEFAEWDYELLNEELFNLPSLDMELFGFEEKKEEQIAEEDNYEEPEQLESIVKKGQVWQLGNHRLMCGDSTDKEIVLKLMDGKKADLILSDPPYGMFLDTDFSSCLGSLGSLGSLGRKSNTRGNKYDKVIGDNDDFKPELITTFFDNFNYCKEIFLFGADYFAELLPNKNDGSWLVWDKRKESQADAIGSEFELIWSKTKHKRRMLRHDWFGFLSSQNAKDAQNRVHPTQKPVSLLVDIVEQWGKDCNNVVDLYGGSGSTLIACEQLNRKCYMMELDEHYCDVIINRWESFTGKKAELIE